MTRSTAKLVPFPARERGWKTVEKFLESRRAPATRRAYEACFRVFKAWAAERGEEALPALPETLAIFLAERAEAGGAVTTIRRYVAALSYKHSEHGLSDPTTDPLIPALIDGVARASRAVPAPKRAIRPEELRAMVAALPETTLGVRDRAILLLGFASALRRSELAGCRVEDVEFCRAGLTLSIRGSKTDQRRTGARVFVVAGEAACPVEALKEWLRLIGEETGPLFRRVARGGRVLANGISGQAVASIVKRAGEAAGLEPERLGGHSLRSGFATAAAARGASPWTIMATTRHRSTAGLQPYIRPEAVAVMAESKPLL